MTTRGDARATQEVERDQIQRASAGDVHYGLRDRRVGGRLQPRQLRKQTMDAAAATAQRVVDAAQTHVRVKLVVSSIGEGAVVMLPEPK